MPDLDRCYRVLGLPPGAPKSEVRKAYKDLAQVWHPDRFAHNDRLRAKADENLRRINEAYETLRDYEPPPGSRSSSSLSETFRAIVGLGDVLKTGEFRRLRKASFRSGRPSGPPSPLVGMGGQSSAERRRGGSRMLVALVVLAVTALAVVVGLLLSQDPPG